MPVSHLKAVAGALFASALAFTAQAEEFAKRDLTSEEIRAWLSDATAFSIGADPAWRQYFSKLGETPYWHGDNPVSNGRWRAQGDRYCSLWPPAGDWDCYSVVGWTEGGERYVTWLSPSDREGSTAKLLAGHHPPQ